MKIKDPAGNQCRIMNLQNFSKFLHQEVLGIASRFSRCNVITNRCFIGSLKTGTRRNSVTRSALVESWFYMPEVRGSNPWHAISLGKCKKNVTIEYHCDML